jgi:hypothetical protein
MHPLGSDSFKCCTQIGYAETLANGGSIETACIDKQRYSCIRYIPGARTTKPGAQNRTSNFLLRSTAPWRVHIIIRLLRQDFVLLLLDRCIHDNSR